MSLTGYTSALSARPGESIDCMVSATSAEVTIDLVRLIHGDENPAGPGQKYDEVPGVASQRVPGRTQTVYLGSCILVPTIGSQPLAGLELEVLVLPTVPGSQREQGIVALTTAAGEPALAAVITPQGVLALRDAAGEIVCSLDIPWRRDTWYRVSVVVSPEGDVELACRDIRFPASTSASGFVTGGQVDGVIIGATGCRRSGRQWVPEHPFNGKIEHPVIRSTASGEPSLVADWRFELAPDGDTCQDVSGHQHHGVVINAPLRGSTGHAWRGREIDFTKAPETYGAIHFHDDDLDDAGWDPSAQVALPDDLPSGIYAVRLRAGDEIEHIPFVVTPPAGGLRNRTAVLLPTFTYIAYANERMVTRLDFEGDQMSDHPIHPGHRDLELAQHPEWGLSLYDVHTDGSTCVYSTSLRPIPNLRPDYRAWLQDAPRHLSADLYLVDWLTELGYGFDVITDHDLNLEGEELLAGYDVIITGSHPEYVSERMLDSLEDHLDRGGSLMYLGGNGFYWVTSQDARRPHLIEVRRGPVGTRPSEGAPGEGVHSTTGEQGGLWRQRGRWPNRLTGIGMTSQGWDSKAPGFRRSPDSCRPEFEFAFAGVEDEVVGDFGLIMNGSSGDELDRFDLDRGSPPETVVLATSTGHSDFYQLVGEDVLATRSGLGGTESPDVRSDITWLEKSGGGAVFSVGSICYTGSLSHNRYDNNLSRVTRNVLDELLSRPGKAGA